MAISHNDLNGMPQVYITRQIPEAGIKLLQGKGYELDISEKDGVLSKEELLSALQAKSYDAVLCLLTDTVNAEVFDAVPNAKIFANYAVGYDNVDIDEAKKRGITITNTPGVLTNAVAEHTMAMMMAIARRIPEADRFTRAGKYQGWGPMMFLGSELQGKTVGILGAGRIGSRVLEMAVRGYGMRATYYDIKQSENIEQEFQAEFRDTPEVLLEEADFVSVHVPLLDSTKHLINSERLAKMKPSAYLVNTSRGPVVDEKALVEVLKNKQIAGAALDVFEEEPALAPGLAELENVITTPHIASATNEARGAMSILAAQSIIDHLEGRTPQNVVS